MTRRVLTLMGCLIVAAACAETPEPDATEEAAVETTEAAPGPSFLALHLYNPASEAVHQQFLAGFGPLNAAIAEAGQPQTQYAAWKVTGDQAGDYGYMFGSIWADRATYDAVHGHEAYATAMAALEEAGIEPAADEIYNRYEQLSPPATDPAPMPGEGPTLLATHLFNLPSAESEQELVSMLEEFNAAVAAAGHPETRYTLWKVTGEQAGDYTYLFGSLWADREVYDAVHAHPAHQSLMETYGEAYQAMVGEEVYNQYERVME
jgi:hypothetical protein